MTASELGRSRDAPGPRWSLTAVLLLALTGVVAVGCSSPSAPAATSATASTDASGVQHLAVSGTDALSFQPSVLHAHTGRLDLTFSVPGATPHTLAVGQLGADTHEVDSGHTATLHLTLTSAGTYRISCDFHPSMSAQLIVG